jgi:hypothetical protein
MSETDYSKYDQLLEQARGSAKYWIPKLCEALRRESSEMSNGDIRERVTNDCLPIWQKSTIRDALPDQYKQKEKAQAGKKGRQKQLEQARGTVTITEEPQVPVRLRAENGSDPLTGQKPHTFDRRSSEGMVTPLQSQLNNTNQEPQETKNEKRQNIEEVPHLDSEEAELVKDDVTRISEIQKRLGTSCLWNRRTDKTNIARDGKASIKFLIFARHKRTKIEYLVPVKFRVDFKKMTTSLVLDGCWI